MPGRRGASLHLSDPPAEADVLASIGDFYLLDDTQVAVMRYDSSGAFAGAEILGDPLAGIYRAAAHAAWTVAEPFAEWWPRHPEHHRAAMAR
ncbi:MAG: DUF6879 family protein [Pseudonocardia sp.]